MNKKNSNNNDVLENENSINIENIINDNENIDVTNEKKSDCLKKILELEDANKELKDNYLRAFAEIDNVKKRSSIEMRKKEKYAISAFAKELLPVMDSLEKALETIPENNSDDNIYQGFVDGMVITLKQLKDTFAKFNITEISSIGEKFSPDKHDVLQTIEDKTKEDGIIVSEWQKGYMIEDRVLRDSKVIVVKNNS